jgi:hypothetical protein
MQHPSYHIDAIFTPFGILYEEWVFEELRVGCTARWFFHQTAQEVRSKHIKVTNIHLPSTNKVACVVRKAVWESRWVALDDGGELRKDVCVRLWWVWVCAHGDFDNR